MSTLRTKDLSSVEMTRVCSSIAHPASPKSKGAQVVAQPLRMHEGGVIKRQPSSPAKSFKTVAKGMTKAECYAQLKNLLPNARNQEVTSEVCRVACKIHGWYSVRVQVLLCAVYILSYRLSFYSLLWWKRRSHTLHIWRVFSVQTTNRLVHIIAPHACGQLTPAYESLFSM